MGGRADPLVMAPMSLQAHRDRIEAVDRLLVAAIALRLRSVAELQGLKRAAGLPLTDAPQEAAVVARARGWAAELGAPPALVERVLRTVVEEGKRAGRPVAPAPEP